MGKRIRWTQSEGRKAAVTERRMKAGMKKEELKRDGNSEGTELSIGFPTLEPINKRTIRM